jgi:hypothetical protein
MMGEPIYGYYAPKLVVLHTFAISPRPKYPKVPEVGMRLSHDLASRHFYRNFFQRYRFAIKRNGDKARTNPTFFTFKRHF